MLLQQKCVSKVIIGLVKLLENEIILLKSESPVCVREMHFVCEQCKKRGEFTEELSDGT